MVNKIKAQSYKTLGRVQARLIEDIEIKNKGLVSPRDVQRILGYDRNSAYQLLHSLKKKEWLEEIERGKYVLLPLGREPVEPIEVACRVVWPSYVTLWTALSYHKLTEQMPLDIFLATTKRSRKINIRYKKIQFVHISPKRFFGYEKLGRIVIADKEKAVIDCLLFPKYIGLDEVCKALDSKELNFERLGEYAIRIGNSSLIRRLGYLIELLGIKEPKLLGLLQKHKGKGIALLDPSEKSSKQYNKKWLLNLNVEKERLIYWKRVY